MFVFWWYFQSTNLLTPQKFFVRPCVARVEILVSHMYKERKKYYERERRKTFVTLWLVNVTQVLAIFLMYIIEKMYSYLKQHKLLLCQKKKVIAML